MTEQIERKLIERIIERTKAIPLPDTNINNQPITEPDVKYKPIPLPTIVTEEKEAKPSTMK